MTVVTRFPPSPTGLLHIGGLRTALYNYLLARKEGGKFIMRIEDTDQARLVPGAEEHLLDMMDVFQISPDESPRKPGSTGPYRQSDRLDIYQTYITKLVDEDKAYYCFCDSARLDEIREKQQEAGLTPKYDRHCRHLTPDEIRSKRDFGEPYTIRLNVPDGIKVEFVDVIRGKISVPSADIDDQILMKSDGFPTYHFASVVDDHLMGVTHVMLGDEWIASGPKKKLIYDALGWDMPTIVYLPSILGKDKKKLSKRQGDVSALSFLERGFLPEAIINYIALIGWNPKTTEEFFSLEQLQERFSLDGIQKASGIFDGEKMEWMNGQYIAKIPTDTLVHRLEAYLEQHCLDFYESVYSRFDTPYNHMIIRELQTRLRTLGDFSHLTRFFYAEPEVAPDLLLNMKMNITTHDQAREYLGIGAEILASYSGDESVDSYKLHFLSTIEKSGYKNGQILWPIRVALTGEMYSPGAIEMMSILGQEKSLARINQLLDSLQELG